MVRRLFGDGFTPKLFYQTCYFIWQMNEKKGLCRDVDVGNNLAFVVTEVFNGDHDKFKANKRFDTWCKMWDDSYEGYVEFETIFQLSKRVGIMGPLAAVLGRLADYHICTEGVKCNFAMKKRLWSHSIRSGRSTRKRDEQT